MEGVAIVNIGAGMHFEFYCRADEEEKERECNKTRAIELSSTMFEASLKYIDIDISENENVVFEYEKRLLAPNPSSRVNPFFTGDFDYHLGHGLSPRDLNDCVLTFYDLASRVLAHGWSKKLFFVIKRRGFWGSTWCARAMEDQDSMACSIYGILGNNKEFGDCCPICLGGLRLGDAACRLRCRHYFHSYCIDKWLSKNRTCPNCRFRVSLEVGALRRTLI